MSTNYRAQAGEMKGGEGKVRAKKSLGQHFLTDLNIARKIAEAVSGGGANSGSGMAAGAATDVLEIGGGMGVLTQFLLERNDITLWGIEIDRESIDYMRRQFPEFATGGENDSGRLIEGDFLKFDLRAFVQTLNKADFRQKCPNLVPTEVAERGIVQIAQPELRNEEVRQAGVFHGNIKIVGNFPYNISSQIFFKVLENRDLVPEVVGMVQREVAQRIAEPPGSRTYGILSVLLQAWYDIEYLFTVSEGVFSPPPKVKSAVVRLKRNSVRELGCDEALFVKVVKAAFGQRRKMLRNSIRAVFGDLGCGNAGRVGGENGDRNASENTGRNGDGALNSGEHPFFSRRAEQLSVAEFVELTNWISGRLTARCP